MKKLLTIIMSIMMMVTVGSANVFAVDLNTGASLFDPVTSGTLTYSGSGQTVFTIPTGMTVSNPDSGMAAKIFYATSVSGASDQVDDPIGTTWKAYDSASGVTITKTNAGTYNLYVAIAERAAGSEDPTVWTIKTINSYAKTIERDTHELTYILYDRYRDETSSPVYVSKSGTDHLIHLTYNGEIQKVMPVYKAVNSTSGYDGLVFGDTTWSTSNWYGSSYSGLGPSDDFTNVGYYWVDADDFSYYETSGIDNYSDETTLANTEIEVIIEPKEISYSVSGVEGLTYTGEAQNLVTGSISGLVAEGDYEIWYSLSGGNNQENYSTTIPQATDAGTYTVYYAVAPKNSQMGENYTLGTDSEGNNISFEYGTTNVTIAKATPTVTVTSASGLTYNGEYQDLVTGTLGNIVDGDENVEIKYAITTSGTTTAPTNGWSTTASGKDAGTYRVWYKVVSHNNNYKGVGPRDSFYVDVTIDEADPTVTAPTAKSVTWTGFLQSLIKAGKVTGVNDADTSKLTMAYALEDVKENEVKFGNETYTTDASAVQGLDMGTYTVYYGVMTEDEVIANNYNLDTISYIEVTIVSPTSRSNSSSESGSVESSATTVAKSLPVTGIE